MGNLSATKVKALDEPGRYGDGEGLYLNVSNAGTQSWVQRIVVDGQRRDIGLGGFPTVSLAKARELSAENRRLVAEGRTPLSSKDRRAEARKARSVETSTPTFRTQAEAFFDWAGRERWTNPKNQKQRPAVVRRYVYPHLGDLPVDQIDAGDVLSILEPLQGEKPEVAKVARTVMRQVFRRAQVRGLIAVNPAGEVIGEELRSQRRRVTHMKSLPYAGVAEALDKVEASGAYEATKLAFRLMVLCASRPGEVRFATWDEFDLDNALWTIQADRMKQSREHRVPLSSHAVEVLRRARALAWDSPWCFPSGSNPGKPLSENAFSKLAKENGISAVPHGFRSSFRNWAEEQSRASWAAIEMSLSHAVGGDVERAYFRSDVLNQRRALMQQWGEFLMG